jgi:hypothetical protein
MVKGGERRRKMMANGVDDARNNNNNRDESSTNATEESSGRGKSREKKPRVSKFVSQFPLPSVGLGWAHPPISPLPNGHIGPHSTSPAEPNPVHNTIPKRGSSSPNNPFFFLYFSRKKFYRQNSF